MDERLRRCLRLRRRANDIALNDSALGDITSYPESSPVQQLQDEESDPESHFRVRDLTKCMRMIRFKPSSDDEEKQHALPNNISMRSRPATSRGPTSEWVGK